MDLSPTAERVSCAVVRSDLEDRRGRGEDETCRVPWLLTAANRHPLLPSGWFSSTGRFGYPTTPIRMDGEGNANSELIPAQETFCTVDGHMNGDVKGRLYRFQDLSIIPEQKVPLQCVIRKLNAVFFTERRSG